MEAKRQKSQYWHKTGKEEQKVEPAKAAGTEIASWRQGREPDTHGFPFQTDKTDDHLLNKTNQKREREGRDYQ